MKTWLTGVIGVVVMMVGAMNVHARPGGTSSGLSEGSIKQLKAQKVDKTKIQPRVAGASK